MSWPKGKPRGPSPRKGVKLGRRTPILDLKILNDLLAGTEDPAVRFQRAFLYTTGALRFSGNATMEAVGERLFEFWEKDMASTMVFTPGWKNDGNSDPV